MGAGGGGGTKAAADVNFFPSLRNGNEYEYGHGRGREREGGGLAYAGARTFQVQIRRRLHSTVESAGFERIHCALSKRESVSGYLHDLQRCSKIQFLLCLFIDAVTPTK